MLGPGVAVLKTVESQHQEYTSMNCIIVLLLTTLLASPVHGSICDHECSNQTSQGKVESYCKAENLTMYNHCCVNSTHNDNFTDSDIVGIDLRNCSIHNVTNLFKNMTSAVIISLEDNPLTAVTEQNFYNLTQLNNLSLPGSIDSCPGGSQAWKSSDHTPDNKILLCETQIDTCETGDNNGTCPSPQSYCAAAGPGLVDCLCSQDYHGYKCLRKGTFPTVPFIGGICSSTVVTAIFLWVTQRRFVKKQAR